LYFYLKIIWLLMRIREWISKIVVFQLLPWVGVLWYSSTLSEEIVVSLTRKELSNSISHHYPTLSTYQLVKSAGMEHSDA
jgi:uncharacterized membrane protein YqjE